MSKNALIFWGGWDGHDPEAVANIFKDILQKENFEVTVSDSLDSISDEDKLKTYDLIVPCYTMGDFPDSHIEAVSNAVISGVGMAGAHGGMCDTTRASLKWKFITGGAFVEHPGGDGVEYEVNIIPSSSPLTKDIKNFRITSEQYYMHVDPANKILATTSVTTPGPHAANGATDMPVAWTKLWGEGRVYYNSLGHNAETFRQTPELMEMMRRGFLWTAAL